VKLRMEDTLLAYQRLRWTILVH